MLAQKAKKNCPIAQVITRHSRHNDSAVYRRKFLRYKPQLNKSTKHVSAPRRIELTSTHPSGKPTDISIVEVSLYLLPVKTRLPLKFGGEVLTEVTCARVRVMVADRKGQKAEGWGETPLSVQWAWPGSASYGQRFSAMSQFCLELARAWAQFEDFGHPLEISSDFQDQLLPDLVANFNRAQRDKTNPMPRLAALVCCSPFDLALHDAYGKVHRLPVYETYNSAFMNRTLSDF